MGGDVLMVNAFYPVILYFFFFRYTSAQNYPSISRKLYLMSFENIMYKKYMGMNVFQGLSNNLKANCGV